MMINKTNFHPIMGGLNIAVLPQIERDLIHSCALGGILRDSIHHEAKVHGAAFDPVGFRNVMQAMSEGVEVLFFAAAWDVCDPKIVGATINLRSLFLKKNGNDIDVHRGIYSEDACLLPAELRKLIHERPRTKSLPDVGLGLPLIQASINHFATHGFKDGSIPVGQTFEFAPSNGKIIAIQEKLGATLGKNEDSALLKIESGRFLKDRFKVPVDVQFVSRTDGTVDPNNFTVSWQNHDESQKIMASFTKGLSTFKGKPITQCQFISNSALPNVSVLESVVFSILKAAEQEIGEGRWGSHHKTVQSPKVPCGGNAKEVFAALFEAQNTALLLPKRCDPLSEAVPPMHIHALQEPEIVAALKSVGAKQRMLGDNPMQTATLDLRKAAEKHNAPRRPLTLISPDAARNDPLFSLVA